MADKITIYKHYYEETKKLLKEVKDYNEYFNTPAMQKYMDKYNTNSSNEKMP